MIPFRCILNSHSAAHQLLADLKEMAKDQTLDKMVPIESTIGALLGLRRAHDQTLLHLHSLSSSAQDELQQLGFARGRYALEFNPNDETMDALGVCWEILVAINAFSPTDIWISTSMYAEEAIRSFAPIRSLTFDDGGRGYVLTAREYASLLDARG